MILNPNFGATHSQMGVSGSHVAEGSGTQQQNIDSVFVVGPSSSGKTTLCDALAEKLQLAPNRHVKEVARKVMTEHGFSRHTVKTYEMQHTIMQAQCKAEQEVLKLGPNDKGQLMMLGDRSAIDPIVYAATSGVAEAAQMCQRLLLEPSIQSTLPFYRKALFGKHIESLRIPDN